MIEFREYFIKVYGRFTLDLPKGAQILGVDSDAHENVHFLALVDTEEEEIEERQFISIRRCVNWHPSNDGGGRYLFDEDEKMENIKYIGISSYKMMYQKAKIYLFEIT